MLQAIGLNKIFLIPGEGDVKDEEYIVSHDSIMAREQSIVSIVFSGETMFSMPAFGT